jgi:hypothetical protein
METKEFNFSGFKRIHVQFAMEFEIVQADAYSITVSGSDVLVNNIDVYLEGDRLVLGYDLNVLSFFTAPFTRAHARIALPELRELKITGAAHGSVRGFNTPNDFDLRVMGASRLDISEMSAGNLKWELSGASHIKGEIKAAGDMDIHIAGASRIDVKGSANDLDLEASGASHLEFEDFAVRNAKIRLTGASRSTVNLDGKLDVTLEGASSLEYMGKATLGEIKVTGASTLKKR